MTEPLTPPERMPAEGWKNVPTPTFTLFTERVR